MKIRKLVAETDVKTTKSSIKATTEIGDDCSIAAQQDYEGAIDCIQNAINMLAHTVQCNKNDVVARESIANLAVVLLDLKGAQQVPDAAPTAVEPLVEEGL